MPKITRKKAQDASVPPVLLELEDTTKKAAARTLSNSNQKIKEIQSDEHRMSLLVELAMETEYWWEVCAGVTRQTVGSKLANAYNETLGLTDENALTWKEASRCFTDFKNKFRATYREGEWGDLLAKEKNPSLRATMFKYLAGEVDYRNKVKNGEIATLSDVSDNEEESEDTDVVLLPSPAPSSDTKSKTTATKRKAPVKQQRVKVPAPTKIVKPHSSKNNSLVKAADKDKLIVELSSKVDKLDFELDMLKVRLDEVGQDNIRLQIQEEKLLNRISILETDTEARLRVLESRSLMTSQGN